LDPDGGPRLRQWQALTTATEAKNRMDDNILEGYAGGNMDLKAVSKGGNG
jgi:hypothetical protein